LAIFNYTKKKGDREKGRRNKRVRLKRGSWNPKHGKRKHYNMHKPSRLNEENS
jgi:hypothetical protein